MSGRGQAAEDFAAAYVEQRGLTIVARNFHCRFGEIDLIAKEGKTLVFIEVRMRSNDAFGGAAASITAGKREKLLRTARHYLSDFTVAPACRFDAVLINGRDNTIEWIKNAFGECLCDNFRMKRAA
jgi:putative endonuclease